MQQRYRTIHFNHKLYLQILMHTSELLKVICFPPIEPVHQQAGSFCSCCYGTCFSAVNMMRSYVRDTSRIQPDMGTAALKILFYIPMHFISWYYLAKHRDHEITQKTKTKRLELWQNTVCAALVVGHINWTRLNKEKLL